MKANSERPLLPGERPARVRSGLARARLRRARPLVTVAELLLPALLVVVTILDFAPRRDWDWSWVAGPIVVFLVAVWHWWTRRYRPRTWPRAAAWLSGIAGFYIAFGLTSGGRNGSLLHSSNQAIGVLFPFLVVVATVLVVWVALRLGRLARRIVLEPFTLELADSPLELVFPSRVDPKQLLRIGRGRLEHPEGTAKLADIGAVGLFTYSGRDPWPSGDKPTGLTPGPAVRFEFLGEVWAFPTDNGQDIAQVIDRRRTVPAPPQRPVRTPSHREPSTITTEKITELMRDASLRAERAVIEFKNNPIANSPAATAALRQEFDQVITELIDTGDLASVDGRRMLRGLAATLQQLRDRLGGSTQEVDNIGDR